VIYFPVILQPKFSHRVAYRMTSRNLMGQNIMSTRKQQEVFHNITYSFDKLSNRQYRIIENHNASVDGGLHSFKLVHWNEPKIVKAIDSKGYITLNNVSRLSVNSGDGGNRIMLWYDSFDYGNDSEASGPVLTDRTKVWVPDEWQNHKVMDTNGRVFNASTNTAKTLTVVTGTLHPGAYNIFRYEEFTISAIDEITRKITLSASPVMSYDTFRQFVMPVYECFYAEDSLGGLQPTGEWNLENNDEYGPFYSGEILFSQRGSG